MKILITGASGLLGTALIGRLWRNHTLIGQSRSARENSSHIKWIKHDLIENSWGDLHLPDIDVIYHLASQTSVYNARENPIADLSANVLGLLNLLEYFKKQSSPPFVVLAGTATEVGVTNQLPINEASPDRPITFYDISKLSAEMYLKQYIKEGWIKGCSLRLSNVFGLSQSGQQKDRGIIDKIFNKAISGQNITIYGDGNFIRDYIFIDDVISALDLAAYYKEETNGRTFYIGSGKGIELKDAFLKIISVAASLTAKPVALEYVNPPVGLSEIEYRNAVIDSSAFKEATGWLPQYDFDSGLEKAYCNSLPRITLT